MNDPLVSVALPVYNGEKYVAEAIESIQHQSFSDWELLIIDDGSKDNSIKICQYYASYDDRIRVIINDKNLGLAKTMNRSVSLARGKYIAIQEQDDISLQDRLMEEVALLESNQEIGLVSCIVAWLNDDGEIFQHYPGRLYLGGTYPEDRNSLISFFYTEGIKAQNPACMFRRAISQKIPGPFDESAKLAIDMQFMLHMAHKTKIGFIPKVLMKVRRGQSHSSYSKNKELLFAETRRYVRLIYNHYKNDHSSPINYALYRKAMATYLIIEGRYYGRWKGSIRLLRALYYNPFNRKAWASSKELMIRAVKKIV
jgi:glycosyltransferase involved in cell wall biosynthesis